MKCLLIYPNPESALNEEAGMLLLEQYEDYFSRAKMMTEIHARSSHKSEHRGASSSSGSDSCTLSSSKGITTGVKRPASNASTATDKKTKDKKKALKRL